MARFVSARAAKKQPTLDEADYFKQSFKKVFCANDRFLWTAPLDTSSLLKWQAFTAKKCSLMGQGMLKNGSFCAFLSFASEQVMCFCGGAFFAGLLAGLTDNNAF